MAGYEKFSVIKSPLDPLKYRIIKLPNGLKALLISSSYEKSPRIIRQGKDIQTEIERFNELNFEIGTTSPSSHKIVNNKPWEPRESQLQESGQFHCFFTFGSGFLNDTFPGIAHFVEHLIFFGSKNYPEYEGITKYCRKHAGDTNAVTQEECTAYELHIDEEGIDESLQRFVDLVCHPNWKTSDIKKEINSINSEFWKLWMVDAMRYRGILNHLANPDHPLAKVSYGHGTSLDVGNIEEHALEWQRRHYVADNLSVVMIGPEALDALTEKIVRHFSSIPSTPKGLLSPREDLMRKFQDVDPFDQTRWNKTYHLIPSIHDNFIWLSWVFPPKYGQDLKTRPLHFLSYLMAYKYGRGLDQYLRQKGWLLKICPHCQTIENSCLNTVFALTVYLTKEGVLHVEEVIREIFFFIQMVHSSPPNEIQRIFYELRQVQADVFHYRSDEHIAVMHLMEENDPAAIEDPDRSVPIFRGFTKFLLSQNDKEFPRILLDTFVSSKWDEDLIKGTLMSLLDPSNANVLIASKSFPKEEMSINWYNIHYGLHKKNFLTEFNIYGGWPWWNSVTGKRAYSLASPESGKYKLPSPNQYSATSVCFPIRVKKDSTKEPYRLSPPNSKKFDFICFPETYRRGYLSTAHYLLEIKSGQGGSSYPLMGVLIKCFEHNLQASLADALANIFSIDVGKSCEKFTVEIMGPSEKLINIFKKVVISFEDLEESITPILFNSSIQEILNALNEEKYHTEKYGTKLVQIVLDRHVCSRRDFVKVLADLKFHDFINFVKRFKAEMKLNVELSGSVSKEEVSTAWRIVRMLKFDERKKPSGGKNHRLRLPSKGEWVLRKKAHNPFEAHNWVTSHYQIGSMTDAERRAMEMLTTNLADEVYFVLRCDKQIGYVAEAFLSYIHSVWNLSVRVNALAYRFSCNYVQKKIDDFMSNYFQKCIMNTRYFNEHIKMDERFSQKFVKMFFEQHFLPSGRNYSKLSVHLEGFMEGVPAGHRWNPTFWNPTEKTKGQEIKEISKFKRDLKKFPNYEINEDGSSDESE